MYAISIIALAIGVGVFVTLAAVSLKFSGSRRSRRGRDGGAIVPLGDDWGDG
jgi:hypothetical protein